MQLSKQIYSYPKEKKDKIYYLLGYILAACSLVLLFKPVYFLSILIVLGPPTVANFLWLEHSRYKVFAFSFAATLLFAPPIELMTRLADVWDVQSIFFRPFGLIPLENMLFAFINFFWGLCFYEYFIDKDKKQALSDRIRSLMIMFVAFSSLIYGMFLFYPTMVRTNYFAMALPILVVPAGFIFWKNPHLLKKTILPTIFFAIVFFVYELVSIHVGSWWWPGEYFYSFLVNGHTFPLDDVIIWYLLSTPVLIGGYEFFADDFA